MSSQAIAKLPSMSLDSLLSTVQGRIPHKRDISVAPSTLKVRIADTGRSIAARTGAYDFGFTSHAHNQLATFLGIPQAYYRTLLTANRPESIDADAPRRRRAAA